MLTNLIPKNPIPVVRYCSCRAGTGAKIADDQNNFGSSRSILSPVEPLHDEGGEEPGGVHHQRDDGDVDVLQL